MQTITEKNVRIPADVPRSAKENYIKNFLSATRNTGNLMLFAGDQKIEHLNDDFYGESSLGPIPEDDGDPAHLFNIASKATIGIFIAQYGLISHYGRDFPNINYLVKLNSKTNLVKTDQADPLSRTMVDVDQVIKLEESSGVNIVGVGLTIYLGSEFEAEMLRQAAQAIHEAHQHGYIVVLWMYPRGKAVPDMKDPHLVAGATGVACALGSDFVKISYPKKEGEKSEDILKEAILAAGRCKVICSGSSSVPPREFLDRLHKQIHVSGASGNATGRNIHQKSLDEAVRFCNAISAITLGGKGLDFAVDVYEGKEEFSL